MTCLGESKFKGVRAMSQAVLQNWKEQRKWAIAQTKDSRLTLPAVGVTNLQKAASVTRFVPRGQSTANFTGPEGKKTHWQQVMIMGHPQPPSKRCPRQWASSQKFMCIFTSLLKLEREPTYPARCLPQDGEGSFIHMATWKENEILSQGSWFFFLLPLPESMNARCSHKTSSYLQDSLRGFYLLLLRGQEAITDL